MISRTLGLSALAKDADIPNTSRTALVKICVLFIFLHQPRQLSSAASEAVGLQAHVVEHARIGIGKWPVVLLVEREVLAVAEASASEMMGRLRMLWMLGSPI